MHPNPLVGAVIVYNGNIIGEGYHTGFGKPHAEVEAIHSVKDKSLLELSTLYVNLEPCAHHGKTPPCADLIISSKIPTVVISNLDPNIKVARKGLEKLGDAGINVITEVGSAEGFKLNRSFFTYHTKERPFIILKWAETVDGYMGRLPNQVDLSKSISNPLSDRYVHDLRAMSDAILIGTSTAVLDNPSLTTRLVQGRNPLRVIIDLEGKIPATHTLFQDGLPNVVFGVERDFPNTDFIKVPDFKTIWTQLLTELFNRQCTQLLVEGGADVLTQFIESGLWDEIHVIKSNTSWDHGLKAPKLENMKPHTVFVLNDNVVTQYLNN